MNPPWTDEVILVGLGRLGSTIARMLEARNIPVRPIRRGMRIPRGPLTYLTVADRDIAAVARQVPEGGVVLHASGATDIAALRPHHPAGSLHPLMTFPGGDVEPPGPGTPAAVAGDPEAVRCALALAQTLDFNPFEITGDRRAYHAAAVVAGNFATTLLAQAAELLVAAGAPKSRAPALLAPLAIASIKNAVEVGPVAALTGPVVRGDDRVIEGHRAALRQYRPEILSTYDELVAATREMLADPEGRCPTAPPLQSTSD